MDTTFIFDLGNVLWQYKPLLHQLKQSWANLSGLTFDEFVDIYHNHYKLLETNQEILDDFILNALHQSNSAPFHQSLKNIYKLSNFNQYINQPLLKYVSSLRQRYSVGFLSNGENFFYPFFQKRFEKHFDFGYVSWQIGIRKPDPIIFQKVLESQQLLPQQVVFIDDTLANVESSQTLGIKGIQFLGNDQLFSVLKNFSI